MLENIQLTNYVFLSMLFILIIQILFKFFIVQSIKLNLSFILFPKMNNKF